MANKILRKKILEISQAILNCPTAPYREKKLREFIIGFCSQRRIAVRQDKMGNVIATYGQQFGKEALAFGAHMDHPGFIIEQDSENKKTTAVFYGGVEKEYFWGTRIRVFSDAAEVKGRITKVKFDTKKFIKRVWLTLEDDVKKGNLAMWDLPSFFVKGDKIYSRACDDCIGCAAMLIMFDELVRRRVKKKVVGIFTVAEEAGLHGAKYLCMNKSISRATPVITIETSRALPGVQLGDGAVVRVGDLQSIFNVNMTEFIRETAKKLQREDKKFIYQRKLMDAGTCESSVYQEFGFKTGAVCIPLANYHNRNAKRKRIAAEYVSITDLENLIKLLLGLVHTSSQLKKFMKSAVPRYDFIHRKLGEWFFW